MPTTLKTFEIKTLNDFTNFIEEQLKLSTDFTLWFRGTSKSEYTLSPSIHRHPVKNTPEEVIQLETDIIDRFNQRSVPFLNSALDRKIDWEVLFFMQHYRIPTRLLDWSENPFIALYFALTNASFEIKQSKKVFSNNAAVWILDPIKWNRESLKDFSYRAGILSVEDNFLNSYKPRSQVPSIREKPVAVFGTHNSHRIVSQRGVFTIFGKRIEPLETTYIKDEFPQDCLVKLIIPAIKIEELINSLTSLGFTDSVVFPDLEGLAKEVTRYFKFNI